MAWNQSTTLNNAPRKPSKPAPSWVKGALAGLLVVVLLGIAAFFIFGGKDEAPKEEKVEKKSTASLKEVRPSLSKQVAKGTEKPKPRPDANGIIDPGPPPNFKGSVITNDNGTVYYSPDPGFAERYRMVRQEVAALPFKTKAELEIAAVIGQKPGSLILETAFPADMEKDFLAHLNDKIEDLPTDSEETRELKQMMRELKPQLKSAMDRGEKLADLLADYRKELSKAYALKENLQQELVEVKRNATSEGEVLDYIQAANKMLDEYGIEHFPTKITPVMKRRIEINNRNQ